MLIGISSILHGQEDETISQQNETAVPSLCNTQRIGDRECIVSDQISNQWRQSVEGNVGPKG